MSKRLEFKCTLNDDCVTCTLELVYSWYYRTRDRGVNFGSSGFEFARGRTRIASPVDYSDFEFREGDKLLGLLRPHFDWCLYMPHSKAKPHTCTIPAHRWPEVKTLIIAYNEYFKSKSKEV